MTIRYILDDSRYWSAALTELQQQSQSTKWQGQTPEEYLLKELQGINQDCHGRWQESEWRVML